MTEVRLAQAGSKEKLRGRNYLGPEQQQAITQAITNSALLGAVKQSLDTDLPVNYFAERFEEMGRRQGIMMDRELRPYVMKLLAAELWVNHRALDTPVKRLLSVTLHQGAIAPELVTEYPEHPRYVVIQAVVHNPGNPREFLRRAGQEIEALSSEPEFREIAKNRPSDIVKSAIDHPSKARVELRKRAFKTGYGQESGTERE
jgi:hypothetical protein